MAADEVSLMEPVLRIVIFFIAFTPLRRRVGNRPAR